MAFESIKDLDLDQLLAEMDEKDNELEKGREEAFKTPDTGLAFSVTDYFDKKKPIIHLRCDLEYLAKDLEEFRNAFKEP